MSLVRQAARLHSLYVLALPGVMGVLFLYGAYDMARIRNYGNAVNVFVLALTCFVPLVLAVVAEFKQRSFLQWLEQNVDSLVTGEAKYRGAPLSEDTQVIVFHLAFSVVVASFKFPSQLLIVGHDRIWWWRTVYSASSFIFGWWGLPWGPVYTLQALHTNLRSLERRRLFDMLTTEGWSAKGSNMAIAPATPPTT